MYSNWPWHTLRHCLKEPAPRMISECLLYICKLSTQTQVTPAPRMISQCLLYICKLPTQTQVTPAPRMISECLLYICKLPTKTQVTPAPRMTSECLLYICKLPTQTQVTSSNCCAGQWIGEIPSITFTSKENQTGDTDLASISDPMLHSNYCWWVEGACVCF